MPKGRFANFARVALGGGVTPPSNLGTQAQAKGRRLQTRPQYSIRQIAIA